jgi:hypothetical protein
MGIDADSASDAWAVGDYADGSGPLQALMAHFDGTAWSLTAGPSLPEAAVYSVAALSTSDAWTAGWTSDDQGRTSTPLALRWNGSTWTRVKTPSPNLAAAFRAIAAVSPDDIWAAGDRAVKGGRNLSLFEHYNGSRWTVVSSPNVPGSDFDLIYSLSALSADDVWAVGLSASFSTVDRTLAMHWNGRKWKVVPTPNGSDNNNELDSVSADAPNDAWAVGVNFVQTSPSLVEHWDGTSWSVVPADPEGPNYNSKAVAAFRPTSVWVVGAQAPPPPHPPSGYAYTERWDGSAWTVVASESPGTDTTVARAVTVISRDLAWMAGDYMNQNDGNGYPLIEQFCS